MHPGKSAGRTYRRFAALAVVLGAHFLLIVLFLQVIENGNRPSATDTQSPSVLILIAPRSADRPVERPADRRTESRQSVPVVAAEKASNDTSIAPQPETPSTHSAIDWRAAGERIARTTAEQAAQSNVRSFGKQPAAPTQNSEQPHPFQWNPEPEKVGFSGLLPYVRIGKRCAVGLGFFACALGDLPQANGHLFDHMDDADAPVSSVPGPDE